MRVGSIGSYGFSDYRISAVYGNPRSLQPIKKIGQETVSGETTAVLERVAKKEEQQPPTVEPEQQLGPEDYLDIMEQMRSLTRFSADTIPMAEAI